VNSKINSDQRSFLYKQLAGEIEAKIRSGAFQPGEKLPSIRMLHRQLNVSITTAHQAYLELETTGLIEARPKSGFYVSPVSLKQLRAPVHDRVSSGPRRVELGSMVNAILKAITDPEMLPLGSSAISTELMPARHFARTMKDMSIREVQARIGYSLTEGSPELRRQLAVRTLGLLNGIDPEDIVVTNGCTEAVTLCLQAILKPGDVLAVEAPTHFGFLQLFKSLSIMVAEVPTHPEYGVEIDALEELLSRTPVKACLFMPNFHNPLGSLMPDENKARLVELLNRREIPVIEDDICGELFFEGNKRPSLLKQFDRKALVLTCSSFSKTVAPGLRVGWTIPGKRFKEKVLRLKAASTVCTSTLDQHLIARFLDSGACERHMRKIRRAVKGQLLKTVVAIGKHFPEDTRLAVPSGGSLLWVGLHPSVDGLGIYRQALEEKISILPGSACSLSGGFRNYIRIGCGHPFTEATEQGIQKLGRIIADLAAGSKRTDFLS